MFSFNHQLVNVTLSDLIQPFQIDIVGIILIVHHVYFHCIFSLECLDEVFDFEFHFINIDVGAPESRLILIGLHWLWILHLLILGSQVPWIFVRTIHYPLSLIILIQHSPLSRSNGLRRFPLLLRRVSFRFRMGTQHSVIGSIRLAIRLHLILFISIYQLSQSVHFGSISWLLYWLDSTAQMKLLYLIPFFTLVAISTQYANYEQMRKA